LAYNLCKADLFIAVGRGPAFPKSRASFRPVLRKGEPSYSLGVIRRPKADSVLTALQLLSTGYVQNLTRDEIRPQQKQDRVRHGFR